MYTSILVTFVTLHTTHSVSFLLIVLNMSCPVCAVKTCCSCMTLTTSTPYHTRLQFTSAFCIMMFVIIFLYYSIYNLGLY